MRPAACIARAARRSVLRLGALLALALVACAAPEVREVDSALVYVRVHAVATDLPSAEQLRQRACILDLRYAAAAAPDAELLAAWLKFHAHRQRPVFVLVNSATGPAVQAALARPGHPAGVLTVGLRGQRFAADITVDDSAENERRGYDAFAAGTTLLALTTDLPAKVRNDEASLSRDPLAEPASPVAADSAAQPGEATPPKDAVLQRAIHLHRGLQALAGATQPPPARK
ncbi:hypothetical protein [Opitutus sp. ER46]|uniref:hypothetical protein n=1 Tax=Opitutus sp. ER46 TaxID=2161864 RepID=UPI000D3124D6|nr:hypothetical protein [Opitutus sp. ER46]PTX92564.1 hypothetical protein DB354_14640 [Opitutus sp. ER46]